MYYIFLDPSNDEADFIVEASTKRQACKLYVNQEESFEDDDERMDAVERIMADDSDTRCYEYGKSIGGVE